MAILLSRFFDKRFDVLAESQRRFCTVEHSPNDNDISLSRIDTDTLSRF